MKISEAKFAESSTRVHQKPAEPIAGQILPDNPFKFIGKEKSAGSGLPLYDFGARWYNPATISDWPDTKTGSHGVLVSGVGL